jgi:PKD repeat protein
VDTVANVNADSTTITMNGDYSITANFEMWSPCQAHFTADKTEVEVGETVTFTNETTGGNPPYLAAAWDFDGDGAADSTAAVQPGETVSWAYDEPGLYTVSLTITGIHATCTATRHDYVTVFETDEEPEPIAWNAPLGDAALIAPNPTAGRPALTAPVACADITVSEGAELWGILYLVEEGPQAGEWLWYVPGFASSTLTQLEPDKMYFVVVSGPCTLTIPQQ